MSEQLTSNSLADRAETIRTIVAESETAVLTSIERALEAGHLLVAAKADCKHGEWLPFLERAGVPERKAQRYMTLARSGLKSDTVSDLGGIKGALEFLSRLDEEDCPFPSEIVPPATVEEINVSAAPLPLSYVRALDALEHCVTRFSEGTYEDACRATRLCNIKSDSWPSGLAMLGTYARISTDNRLTELCAKADAMATARNA